MSGPTELLPIGLVSRVTGTKKLGATLNVSLVAVPVTEAVPELSYVGGIALHLAKGASGGNPDLAAEVSANRARAASSCTPPKLVKFGAHLDTVELREAFLGTWPPQVKLTLAIRTTEELGVALAAAGINCDWSVRELGPYSAGIPVGPVVVPVYATIPLKAGVHINGTLQAGTVHIASTTVAHAAAGWDETAASLDQQGSNVWTTGVLALTGNARLSASIGVQAGIGIAKGANVHLEAGFGPEFDWSSGHNCELLLDLGSLSAGVTVLGKSLNTPAFTPFQAHLWTGCHPASSGGGGGGDGGDGGGAAGGGGAGGGGGGGGSGGSTEQVLVSPHGSTTGPAGLQIPYTAPACPPGPGETAFLVIGGGQYRRAGTPAELAGPIEATFSTRELAPGSHQLGFLCETQGDGTRHVLWESTGFSVTITAPATPVQLNALTATPGQTMEAISGAPAGSSACPVVDSTPWSVVDVDLLDFDSLASLAHYEYTLSSPEVLALSSLPFEVPPTVKHGSHFFVYVLCVDLSSATVGHPVPAFEYFRPGIVAVG